MLADEFHLAIVLVHHLRKGTADDVRIATKNALATMHGCNGFILSPVDNITEITPNAWRNVDVLVETWKELR